MMTDKQIIIDGVDVSGCKNFSCGKCEEENKIPITINHLTADCRMYPNCYYKQLKRKEQECEELIRRITKIFACLIKANRTNKIVDTLWVDNITTLWDYIAQTLGIEVDPVQIEEQILQKISEVEND